MHDLFLGRNISRLTIGQALADAAAAYGDKTYLHDLATDRRYSFAEVDRLSNSQARGLHASGLEKGMHVALMMDNSDDMLLLYFALGKLGAVVIPLNPETRGARLGYFLTLCQVSAVICDSAHLDGLGSVLPDHPAVCKVLVRGAEQPLPHWPNVDLRALSATHSDDDAPFDNDVLFSDLACLALTSGTTGPSKAVAFPQATMMLIALSYAEAYGYTVTDTYYICLPLFHTSSLRGAAFVALLSGGSVALAPRFSVSGFWDDIRRSGATTFDLLGAMASFLWKAPETALDRSHRVRFARLAPVPPFARAFETRFGIRIASTYGLTDAGAPMAFSPDDPAGKLGSCGKLRPGWDLRIVDESDFEVPAGARGEILVRAHVPWLMPGGYFNMPDATVAAWRNGWFHTGDIGYLDADGYLFFTDRKKDVIRRRGENISAWEVENALLAHPAVQVAAVYPVSSPHGEDEVAASVVLRAESAEDPAQLTDELRNTLLAHMVPQHLEVVSELPLSVSQKVDKTALRQRMQQKIQAHDRKTT